MDNNRPRFDDNLGEGFDTEKLTANREHAQNGQPETSDDISGNRRSAFDADHLGEGIGIGNEHFEEDGGADLGFGETDETEDKDRENPLRIAPGGSTSDGSNEGNYSDGKGNPVRNAGKRSGK